MCEITDYPGVIFHLVKLDHSIIEHHNQYESVVTISGSFSPCRPCQPGYDMRLFSFTQLTLLEISPTQTLTFYLFVTISILS